MKKQIILLYLLLLFAVFASPVCAKASVDLDETHFPDQAFREHLTQYDSDADGVLDDWELKTITELRTSYAWNGPETTEERGWGIDFNDELDIEPLFEESIDITGIKYLTSLKKVCLAGVTNTEVDFSKNKKLQWLALEDGSIKKINLKKNSKLIGLSIAANKVSSVNIDKCTALKYFSCNRNKLKNLNIKKNKSLLFLDCSANKLTSLDIVSNKKLKEVRADYNKLSAVRASSAVAKLKVLYLSNNSFSKKLILSYFSSLENLAVDGNLKMKEIDVSGLKKLKYFHVGGKKLQTIKFRSKGRLEDLTVVDSPKLKKLDLKKQTKLKCLYVKKCKNLSSISLKKNSTVEVIYLEKTKIRAIDLSNQKNVYEIDVPKGTKVKLPGMSAPAAVTKEGEFYEGWTISVYPGEDNVDLFMIYNQENYEKHLDRIG